MIRFFRTLRQKLLSENKVRNYLLYAAGEIALVMIGILLALQVNNRNETLRQTEYQLAQLSNLRTEIISMKAFLNTQIGYFELAREGNRVFLNIMESDQPLSVNPDSINSLIRSTLNTDFVTSNRLSLETEINFELLPDHSYAELEKRLQDWRHFAEKIGGDFQLIENNRENDLTQVMINAGFPGWQVLYQNYNPPNFPIDYEALIKDRAVYAILYYRLKRVEGIIRDMSDGITDLDVMLSEMDQGN